jgi:Bacterial Ig domain/Purple acid Phosphatase, N-terminal domain/Glucodextranase, domain B/Abnormal spindle-like microcephaly-assoc'd, ASPM-SPD-2-Hydin
LPGTNARSAVFWVGLGLFLYQVLLVTAPGSAGTLDATWTAPTTNADGSPLTDLASYRLYYDTSSSPCPGSSSVQVASPTSSPGTNQTVSFRLSGLTTGTLYNVGVSAVNADGVQSACSSVASAVARADFSVSPTGTVNFGSVALGSTAERTFTVSNTGGGTLSGNVSVTAPFSIVSGSPFTLSGAGATQAVNVRFKPTTATTVTTNLSFTAGGSTISSIVTGTGASETTPPTVAITSPTSGSTYTVTSPSLGLQGTASDNVGVTQVAWANSRGGSGIAAGTSSWSASAIPLRLGSNALTVTARDAAGNTATDNLTVTLSDTTSPTVAVTAPATGTTVTSTVVVSGSASDNIGVAGVQFKLDGVNLGPEVITPPYNVTWNTTTTADGAHVLKAVARDAAGNVATSTGVTVTVANLSAQATTDVTSPVISKVSLSVKASSVTIGWRTNEPSDSQVEYGPTSSYGNLAPLNTTRVTSHEQTINGLAPNTWYQFRIRSRDAAGNLGVSGSYKFKTRPSK